MALGDVGLREPIASIALLTPRTMVLSFEKLQQLWTYAFYP